MPHIIVLGEAMELLEQRMATPPTSAQEALMNALYSADEWAHDHPEESEYITAIEEVGTAIKGYLEAYPQPSDIRLQSYADQLNAIVP